MTLVFPFESDLSAEAFAGYFSAVWAAPDHVGDAAYGYNGDSVKGRDGGGSVASITTVHIALQTPHAPERSCTSQG